ncbi:MAG: FliI/YscN family ATPase [Candidatus Hydrogenedentes bacterium]|nr:FliI/YscN family ATPase [Candidatus Hydrogenedentota bacterium]
MLESILSIVEKKAILKVCGKVKNVTGIVIEATGPEMNVGDLCYISSRDRKQKVPAEVVGFRDGLYQIMALSEVYGLGPDYILIPTYAQRSVGVGDSLLGRVIDALGVPIDGKPPYSITERRPLYAEPPSPIFRPRVLKPFITGIKSIDGCITCGKGQRVAILSGSGVGKSKLIGMIARNTKADVNVIALVGERGKEVREFLELDLGEEGLKRSVVVVATSHESPLRRISAGYVATTIAEYFRDKGADVLLMMDSITRFAMARREIGLSIGEPPATKGYTPSVFSLLPKLLERVGTSERGTITGFYTVLVEADDLNDPIGDAVRSITDGHISLSRALAVRGHYPPVDVLESVSRSMLEVTEEEHRELARKIRSVLAVYRDAEDLINIGAYVPGSNREIDEAIVLLPKIRKFLIQDLYEKVEWSEMIQQMKVAVRGNG